MNDDNYSGYGLLVYENFYVFLWVCPPAEPGKQPVEIIQTMEK
jgi:hypothetical protein